MVCALANWFTSEFRWNGRLYEWCAKYGSNTNHINIYQANKNSITPPNIAASHFVLTAIWNWNTELDWFSFNYISKSRFPVVFICGRFVKFFFGPHFKHLKTKQLQSLFWPMEVLLRVLNCRIRIIINEMPFINA